LNGAVLADLDHFHFFSERLLKPFLIVSLT